ncbi:MAG: AbrB/MazE/SpoVT family DNA-binding domain-containing protein [Hydrogenovibrio crunogenus]|nr:AbrB/MazE/SpoVT family DNA-binding domain-containing protein [Hydrogenovibrio crunogenus]
MRTSIRKIGNSAGMTIPAPLLKSLGISLGDEIEIETQDGALVIKKLTKRPRYTLAQLLSECDESQPMPQEVASWDSTESVGNEVW